MYGPVPSRRLGRSLGVDLVPFKTCTYDCVYCQLGRTTDASVERREYVAVSKVLNELAQRLALDESADVISLAGSGEPTLNLGLDRLIDGIKALTDIPVAVITNGSLLWMPEMQQELAEADLVLPSLDAGDPQMFERINRPHPALDFDRMVEGLISFTQSFRGEVWLEVMLLQGLTAQPTEAKKIAGLVGKIAPARTQPNTASRPPAEGSVHPVAQEEMPALAHLFPGHVEIICEFAAHRAAPTPAAETADTEEVSDTDIMALLGRRPCTADDIADGLELHVLDVLKRLDILAAAHEVSSVMVGDKVFYALSGSDVSRMA